MLIGPVALQAIRFEDGPDLLGEIHRAGRRRRRIGGCERRYAEERDGNIAAGQALTHDPRAYDDRQQQPRAERLRCQARLEVEVLKWRL